ncbi:unnamed protein product [Acanthoscelides obtectus]|uniref:Uncharacterized protein n=1 Tax=Acanthoscelides obtectus TaxID=200917 RepID=A0A9P0Q3L0_ACAOB|nr:unnamed protein product [Acanthoscelides obtectus]CAK1677120.1 hypothetical protein AOBTE_LOCUS31124 [Acanthoscelides obtectus]
MKSILLVIKTEAVENENGVQHNGSGRKKHDTMTLIPTLMVSKSPVSMAEIKKLSCKDIPFEDLRRCRQKFYSQKDKVKQDTKLSHLIEIGTPRRKKRSDQSFTRNRNITLSTERWREDEELQWLRPIFPEPLEELQENSDEDNDEDNAQEVCNCIEDDGGVKV